MDEIERVIKYIKSCREANIDVTITIDKSRSHLILNALQTFVSTTDLECGITQCCGYDFGEEAFRKKIRVKYCPMCGKRIAKVN